VTGRLSIEPIDRPLRAAIGTIPGSKSISNRALVCAALANGRSPIRRIAPGDDTAAMLDCLRALGVGVEQAGDDEVVIDGLDGAITVGGVRLQARLAGTTSRFITALAALGAGPFVIDGYPPLRVRPMVPLHDALVTLGASLKSGGRWGYLPVEISGGEMAGGTVTMPGDVSSQYITALMLIAPYLRHGLDIQLTTDLVSRPYVDMTASVMGAFGVAAVDIGERRIVVGPGRYQATDYPIEVDASSASYAFAAAAIVGGSITVDGLGSTSLQGDARFASVLRSMGATVEVADERTTVTVDGPLRGIDIDMADISDTTPTLAVVAAFATTPTTIRGVEFIRRKESDRISALVTELGKCGADIEEHVDGLTIRPAVLHGATVDTYHDHRIAMAIALVGLRVAGIEIKDPDVVSKSWPDYWRLLTDLRRETK
jgi:3-phosphoshikimate 1-carboxyvinyltransferase